LLVNINHMLVFRFEDQKVPRPKLDKHLLTEFHPLYDHAAGVC